jgi:hypothetical protein
MDIVKKFEFCGYMSSETMQIYDLHENLRFAVRARDNRLCWGIIRVNENVPLCQIQHSFNLKDGEQIPLGITRSQVKTLLDIYYDFVDDEILY